MTHTQADGERCDECRAVGFHKWSCSQREGRQLEVPVDQIPEGGFAVTGFFETLVGSERVESSMTFGEEER